MKKLFSLLLCVIMVFSLFACSSSDAPTTGATGEAPTQATDPSIPTPEINSDFLAGFGSADITPDWSVPLLGYGTSTDRMSDGVLSHLYSHCLAVRDKDGNTALLITVDSAAISHSASIASKIAQKTGVPVTNIMIGTAHQHSTPDYSADSKYKTLMDNGIIASAESAIADLAPAEIYGTTTETKYLTFVRNYFLTNGQPYGDNMGSIPAGEKVDRHESEADNTLQLLKFVRGSDKKDIVVANFQGHPKIGSTIETVYGRERRNKVHADTIGVFRDELTAMLDCNVMYFSGAGGNLNFASRIVKENRFTTMETHGKKLAEYAYKAEDTYVKLETGKVQGLSATKTYGTDKSQEHLYDRAVEFMKIWNKSGQAAAEAALKDFPEFHSVYHGKYVTIKHDLAATRNLNVYAISFGDVGFAGAPVEMFDENGEQIKTNSPFKMTFVTSLTNGTDGYVPSQRGFDNGGYSTDITRYAPGTGEQLASDLVSLLTQMKNAQ